MKLSEQWLREWIDIPLSMSQLAEQLTLAGLEVESVSAVAGHFSKVVIGYIKEIKPHPHASRLQICQIDTGADKLLSIVCGAPNARAGLKVAVALVGACLAKQVIIQETTLRGEPSQGMLCSTAELGLTETSEGILELPSDAVIGEDLREYLQLNDQCIDIHITPNRGDCLSILGVARELAAITERPFSSAVILNKTPLTPIISDKLDVHVESINDCPRYCGRVIQAINTSAQTPIWLAERLRRSGFHSIHPVVDVTNYILLELGQPLHAFDLSRLGKKISVRRAHAHEKLVLLEGRAVTLDEETLVVADETRVQAIAGVMGGEYSAVSETTSAIFLESAFFDPSHMAGCARRYGLTSDAAYRFERGVDPALTRQAIERATQLLGEIVGGKPGPVVEIGQAMVNATSSILFHQSSAKRCLGIDLTEKDIESIFKRLGITFIRQSGSEPAWKVTPPTWRFDIALEVDLIEELARIHGYNNIPSASPDTSLRLLPHRENQLSVSRLRYLLMDRGYHEAINYSFISPSLQKLIEPESIPLTLLNPISSELSVMRSSLWPGLLNAVHYNQKRQQLRVRLFEVGTCFQYTDEHYHETAYLSAVASGDTIPEQWGLPKKPLDFFTVKSDIESLLHLTGKCIDIQFVADNPHPALHPGQCAAILYAGSQIGYLGALHPSLVSTLDLAGPIYLFELSLSDLMQGTLPLFKPFSKFPIVRRDLSFWVDKAISAQLILNQVREVAGNCLHKTYLFDVYFDKEAKEGKRSLGLALLWQHPDRTLVDKEVDELVKKIIENLKQCFFIQLRE